MIAWNGKLVYTYFTDLLAFVCFNQLLLRNYSFYLLNYRYLYFKKQLLTNNAVLNRFTS